MDKHGTSVCKSGLRGIAAVVIGTLSVTVSAASVTYLPNAKSGDIYDWSTVGNWHNVNGNAYSKVPTSSDTVYFTNQTFATEWLVIPSGVSAVAKSLRMNNYASGVSNSKGVKLRIDGGSLTTESASAASPSESTIGCNAGSSPTLSIENGGSWTAYGTAVVGFGGATDACLYVDAGSSADFKADVIVGKQGKNNNGVVGVVTNFGTVAVAGTTYIMYPNSADAQGRSRSSELVNGGTFTSTATALIGYLGNTTGFLKNLSGGEMSFGGTVCVGAQADAAGVFVNEGTATFKTVHLGGTNTATSADSLAATAFATNSGTLSATTLSVASQKGSTAVLRNDGTLKLSATSYIGRGAGSSGVLENYGTFDCSGSSIQIRVGEYGHGRFVAGADTTLIGMLYAGLKNGGAGEIVITNGANLFVSAMQIGYGEGGAGLLEVYEGSSVESTNTCRFCSQATAKATLRMLGGTYTPGNGKTLEIGSNSAATDASNGRAEGWGAVSTVNPSDTAKTAKLTLYNGVVQADGYGVARDLDFSLVGPVNASSGLSINTCGTNGWHAANKGRLRYPARFSTASTAVRIVGDYGQRTATKANLPLVNSFAATFSSPSVISGKYLYAELYANDREDIPAGLPDGYDGLAPFGIWRAALSTATAVGGISTENASEFGAVTVLLHHGGAGTLAAIKSANGGSWPDGLRLAVCQHDGTAGGQWRRVATLEPGDDGFVEAVLTESAAAWNMGWFAVVPIDATGLAVVIR